MVGWVLEDDAEGQALSELVRTLAGSAGIDAAHLGKQPGSGGVHSLEMLFGASGH